MSSRGDGSRTALIIALLLLSLLATAFLAGQAHYSFRSHRAAAESVLRDYAALAANELVRRGAARVGYDGYYPLVTALSRKLEAGESLEAAVRALEQNAEERLEAALPLAREYFALRGGALEGARVPEELLETLGAPREENAPFTARRGLREGKATTIVFRESGGIVSGFILDPEPLSAYFRRAFESAPLLPPSLGSGEVTNELIHASILDPDGIERFRSEGIDVPEFGVDVPFGDAYEGVLDGFRVHLSIHPDAAPRLVIGGLPPSRLPLLSGLLFLTTGLLATAMLQLRRERLLQRLRSDFVASVSHELRTPLTQIRMFAETLILGRVRSEEERRRSLRIIDREVRRLTHLVENILSFSRVERGRIVLSPEAAALTPRVQETIDLFQPMIAEDRVRIVTKLEPGVRAVFDADAVRQIILNLLDNAVKYGPADQSIVVSVDSRNGAARIVVEDEGPGIPPRERERVFDRFYRLAREQGSAVAGTGIGLSVVRELASQLGGRTTVESGVKGGARIVVELPGVPA